MYFGFKFKLSIIYRLADIQRKKQLFMNIHDIYYKFMNIQ